MPLKNLFLYGCIALFFFTGIPLQTVAQRKSEKLSKKDLKLIEDELLFNEEMPLSFRDSLPVDKRTEEKKKKWKRREFYGIKTKKAFVKKMKRRKRQIELFFILKEYEDPDRYITDIHWYHIKKKKLYRGRISKKDKPYARLLHGPYELMLDGETLIDGIFYKGLKHGRWEYYAEGVDYDNRDGEEGMKKIKATKDDDYQVLNDKQKYEKGWPKSYEISYYDADKTVIKEVMPYDMDGYLNGTYIYYFENGNPKLIGKYVNNYKYKTWKEYIMVGRRHKTLKKINYGKYGDQEELMVEYDENGKLIYDNARNIDRRDLEEDEEDEDEDSKEDFEEEK